MGLSDIPPPTTLSLKRCRSEDPSSLTDLCAPLPKQAASPSPPLICNHHLSLLADLENSLDAPGFEAPTPEELVMEMMKSLQKVMGDIGELVFVPDKVDTIADSSQQHDLSRHIASDYAESDLVVVSSQSTLCVPITNTIANSLQMCDSINGMISVECDVASELDSYVRESSDACVAGHCDAAAKDDDDLCPWDESYVEQGSLENGRHHSDHVGVADMQHFLHMLDDELGISMAGAAMRASAGEVRDEQWSLLGDFAAVDASNDSLVDVGAAFLEEGDEFPSFTLSQDEEGMLAKARARE